MSTTADQQGVSEVLAASYPALLKGSYDDAVLARALPLMTRANPALLRSGTYYVATASDRQILGCGGWTPERPGSGETIVGLGHLRHFATHPDWTGRGIATALFQRCRADARAAQVTALECNATRNAVPFYESLGFVAVDEISVRLAPDVLFPSVVMRLRLQQS